ncbi:MAG: class I SAM-dependent methyltransferase [Cyclobacteriaceae bacterium]
MESQKELVKDFWNEASCGENLYMKGEDARAQFDNQLKIRYELEPYITSFAEFDMHKGEKVLEVGVGLGADHQMFAQNGALTFGVDLTERAIEQTKKRFALLDLKSTLLVADAENLPFGKNEFDMVYSWGVIHHSPNTPQAISEIHRVLKKGGNARIMIYYKYSMIGLMLWVRYGLFNLKPFTSLKELYARYLESPGTKAYSIREAQELFKAFDEVQIETVLTHGDLLSSGAGQRHKGILLNIARKIYPRFIIRNLFSKNGLFMLIRLTK